MAGYYAPLHNGLPVNPSLKFFLYHSRRAPGEPITAVGEIVRQARAFNASHGITGLLVFDGDRFCQFIEGPAEDIDALARRLEADRRHVAFTRVAEGTASARQYPSWRMGYANLDKSEFLSNLVTRPADESLRLLHETAGTLDIC